MKQRKRFNITTRYVLIVGLLLLAANIILGIIDFRRSTQTIKALINKDMLDLANTAAALINGDELGALTEDDVGSDVFNGILERLSAFQNHADIHFIYAIRQTGERQFVFTVDADPDDPGDFGEEVVVTDGMVAAGAGTPSVDDEPFADRWGNYYSAYSPVFDSSGKVAGVIGVDFDADWYEEQVKMNTISITFTSLLSMLGIALVVFLITRSLQSRFHELNTGLSELSKDVDKLTMEIGSISGGLPDSSTDEDVEDELEEIRGKIDRTQTNLRMYLDYLQTQAYVDAMTKVRSSRAYHEKLSEIGTKIENGTADFSVAVFDINSLKEINDQYGHEYGDQIIVAAANAISSAFGVNNTYRIGGDEYVAFMENTDEAAMAEKMKQVDTAVAAYNASEEKSGVFLAVSKGASSFIPGQDTSFKEVFSRADKIMYNDKTAYYQTYADRRRNQRFIDGKT